MKTTEVSFAPVLKSGTLMGLSLGSLYEGILPLGTFSEWQEAWHICSWLISIYGVMMLWTALSNPYTPRSGKTFFGSFLVGWGLYLFLMHALIYMIKLGPQGPGAEIVLMGLGIALTTLGAITVRRARRSFFQRILATIHERDVLDRRQSPPPFNP